MDISGELYDLLGNYLSGRLQRVILNSQTSSRRPILAGVPEGSILDLLLFLIYISDLPNELKSNSNFLLMTHPYLLSLKMKMKVVMFSIMTFH